MKKISYFNHINKGDEDVHLPQVPQHTDRLPYTTNHSYKLLPNLEQRSASYEDITLSKQRAASLMSIRSFSNKEVDIYISDEKSGS